MIKSKRNRSRGARLLVIAIAGLIAVTGQASHRADPQKTVLAVYPIDTRQINHRLSPQLTSLVRSELVKSDKLSIIPEELFFELVIKQDMQASDYYEQRADQVQLGKLLKADKIVIGTLGNAGQGPLLTLEVVDVAKGYIDYSVHVKGKECNNDYSAMAALAGKRLRNIYDPEKEPPPPPKIGHMDLPDPPETLTPKGVEIESKPRYELKGHRQNVHCLAYSPDGKLLFSGATDRSIRVWNADSGEYVRSLQTHTGTVLSLAVTRDGTRLASGSRDGTVVIWDLETFQPLEQFKIGGDVYGVAWSPDGLRLATAGGSSIVMHEKRDDKWNRTWANGLTEVLSLAYAPDGDQVAAGNKYGSIRIYDADTGNLIYRAERGEDMREVRCVTYDPYKRSLASGSDDDLVHVWSTKLIETNKMGGHMGDVNAAVFTEDGSVLITAGNDNRVRAWSPETGDQYAEQRAGRSDLLALAIRPGADEIAIAGRDSTVRVFKFKVIN